MIQTAANPAGRRSAATPRPDRELVAAIRAELAGVEPARACCRRAARAGLGRGAAGRRSPALVRMAHRLGHDEASFDWSGAAPHCRTAFLRGLFLGCGSLSLAAGRTHLEFVVPAADLPTIAGWLDVIGLPANSRVRRGKGVLAWKGTETVISFLRRAGANTAAMELEALLVRRSLRGHLNRVVNAESANLRRSVASSRRQLSTIRALVDAGDLKRLSRQARAVAIARLRAPEATFSELAAGLGISRALVQRAIAEIDERALHLDGQPSGEPEPPTDR